MNKSTYDKINEFCTEKTDGVLIQAERDYVLRKFLDSYYAAISTYFESHNSYPSTKDEQTIVDSLLNKDNLTNYVDSAKIYYDKFKNNIENEFRKKQDKPAFWKSVFISIFANLIYSLILFIVFLVAKDQIATWLMQLNL